MPVGGLDMSNFVKIENGIYRNQPIEGVFPLVKPTQQGKKGYFVTVDASALLGSRAYFNPCCSTDTSKC